MRFHVWIALSILYLIENLAESSSIVVYEKLAAGLETNHLKKAEPLRTKIRAKRSELSNLENIHPQSTSARLKLNNFKLKEYYFQIGIGNPTQIFDVQIDSGSGDLWVPTMACRYFPKIDSSVPRNLYNSSISLTYKENEEKVALYYGSGFVKGRLSYDDIEFGDIVIKNQIFVEADSICGFDKSSGDGLIGLGRSISNKTSIFESMINQGLIAEPLISIYFTSDSYETKEAGELILGAIDPDKYYGELVYSDLIGSRHSWMIRIENVALDFNGNSNEMEDRNRTESTLAKTFYCSNGCEAAVDTGSTFIVVPKVEGVPLLERLGAIKKGDTSEYLAPNCDDLSALPDLIFTISGGEFRLKPEHYVVRTEGPCYIGIMTAPGLFGMLNPPWILGDSFLRQFYTVFDQGNKRVGFAPVRR